MMTCWFLNLFTLLIFIPWSIISKESFCSALKLIREARVSAFLLVLPQAVFIIVTLKLSLFAFTICTVVFLITALSSSVPSKGCMLNQLFFVNLVPGAKVVTSRDLIPGFGNNISCSFIFDECLKSFESDAISKMILTQPITHIALKPNFSILLPVFILASFLIIHVITAIIGAIIKNNSVPHANTFCHPSVSKKSFIGNTPIAAMPKPNKANMREIPTIARIKYTKPFTSNTIISPKDRPLFLAKLSASAPTFFPLSFATFTTSFPNF